MKRRQFLAQAALGVGVLILDDRPAFPQALKEFRIGYQKNGMLVIARQQAALEKRSPDAASS